MKKMSPNGPKVIRIVAMIVASIVGLMVVGLLIASIFVTENIRQWLWYIALGLAIVLVLYILIGVWLKPKYQYRIFGYEYSQQSVVIRKGFLWITQTKIPVFRIQNIDLEEGFFMRKYDLVTVTLSTAGGNHQLTLLNKNDANHIIKLIKKHGNLSEENVDLLHSQQKYEYEDHDVQKEELQ